MTLNLKTLESGDTIELRCGGRVVVMDVSLFAPARYKVMVDNTHAFYFQDGRAYANIECFFDIVAIHKNPKPETYHYCVPPIISVPEWAHHTKILLTKHLTGEVTAEVVK